MDKFKSVAKGGWHPEKERTNSGSSAGGQSDSKIGQVKGWVGKAQGKDLHAEAAREHQSTPLSSLKDPASFAPPPKRLDYNAGSSAAAGARSPTGLASAPAAGAKQRLQEREEARRQAEEEANKPAPGPYRSNTTGLSTAHLPKPPAFRPGAASAASPAPPPKPKPSLPPRLPPRQNSNPDEFTPPPPPTYNEATQQGTPAQGVMNQAALGRLGQAGVAVTGLGIGRTASPPVPPRANPSPPVPARAKPSPPVPPRQNSGLSVSSQETPTTNQGSQMSELQSRFARLSGPKSPAEPPAMGTSWADKQAALRTASNLRNDPSKVSASDLKGAASTANNFQQRHGEQVASGWKSANSLNQKYGIAAKVNNLASSSASPPPPAPAVQSPVASSQGGLGKKAPPPPPPKKKDLSGGSGSGSSNEPPPIPLSSKPKF